MLSALLVSPCDHNFCNTNKKPFRIHEKFFEIPFMNGFNGLNKSILTKMAYTKSNKIRMIMQRWLHTDQVRHQCFQSNVLGLKK